MMQFGVCGSPSMAAKVAAMGYDFVEWTVGSLLKPKEPQDAFESVLATVREASLPIPVVNCFVPGDLKITGPDVDMAALQTYVTTACCRARSAGVDTIVFGSGGARRIPDGFDASVAQKQLVDFGSMIAPTALDHGVTIVVEPLNKGDCNVLTTVAESADYVRAVSHPGLQLLVDAYHLLKDGDSVDDIVTNGELLKHVHIATIPERRAPGCEPCDLLPFFRALVQGGYDGRVSIEGKIPDADEDLPKALETMKALEAEARKG